MKGWNRTANLLSSGLKSAKRIEDGAKRFFLKHKLTYSNDEVSKDPPHAEQSEPDANRSDTAFKL